MKYWNERLHIHIVLNCPQVAFALIDYVIFIRNIDSNSCSVLH